MYLVIPSPYVLLGFQSFVLALSAWPLYNLARRKFDSPAIGLVAAFCALAYPPLGFLNRYDFHGEVVAIPLLIAAYERMDAGDLTRSSLFLALALLGKENIGLTVAAFGLLAFLYHKHRRFGLAWTLGGLAYSLVALFVVIPAFRGAPSDTLARYHWLGETPLEMLGTALSHPSLVLQKVATVDHMVTLLQLLGPLAFLPLLSLPALLPAVLTLSYNFLAQWPSKAVIYYHYMAPAIPFISIAGVLGLHRLTTGPLRSDRVTGLGVSMMLAATLASWAYQNPITGNTFLSSVTISQGVQAAKDAPKAPQASIILPNDAAIREGLKRTPDDVYLLTTSNYLPHLSHRPQIKMIPRAPVSGLEPGVGAIFLNLKDLRWRSCDDYVESLKAAAGLGFGVVFYRDGVLLVQKDRGDSRKLKNLLDHWSGCT